MRLAAAILLMLLSALLTGTAAADTADPTPPTSTINQNFHWT